MNDLAETLINITQDNMKRRLWQDFIERFRDADAQGRKLMKIRGSYNQVPDLIQQVKDLGFQVWERNGETWFCWAGVFD